MSHPPITSIEDLQSSYHSLIPISAHMGMSVEAYDGRSLSVSAPLENNINHQLSAFGGSLFSLAALAGWGILQLKLAELGVQGNTVIAGGDVSYQQPVFETLRCRCTLPPEYDAFASHLVQNGKASLILQSQFHLASSPETAAMTFNGKYAVRLDRD
ncbi:MAG: YiiD C-terminal domain-containing protein [Pseudomonadales bacterium]|nr:YiiD C-terminal domain-containing protein [Pseudomonadales bacterium]MDG1442017.1 YiiD C-terminal domain-containing protein [Pseudomonadales bacterium]